MEDIKTIAKDCSVDDEVDCSYTDAIVCPYCGYEENDSWEYAGDEDDDLQVMACGNCEKEFEYITHIDVSFTSIPQPGPNGKA